jgi:hypothetical protein
MSSGSHSRRPQYNPVRDRRRIMAAILSLAIVLIAISEARKPENWKWLTQGAAESDRNRAPVSGPVSDVLAPDEVRIVPRPDDRESRAELREQHQPSEVSLRIPAEYLDAVEESRVGVRAMERPAYFAMLSTARAANPRDLAAAARRDLPFLSLMNDSAEHRGEVIWIEGELRRVEPLEAGPNDDGFEQLYEGWLFTDEAGRTNPYRIVVSELPPGFPQGSEVRERIRLPAYFFKRYTYATAHGQHSAPMLIGYRWTRVVGRGGAVPGSSSPNWWPLGLTLIAASWLGLQFFRYRLSRPAHRHQTQPLPAELAADVADGTPAPDPREFLGQLAEQNRPQQ